LTAVNRGDREFTLRGDGRNLIDFMYVDDAVRGLLALVTDSRPVRATVDFASGQPTSVNDVVNAMVRLTGSDMQIRRDGHSEEYIEFRSGDTTLKDQFGFEPRVSFEDMRNSFVSDSIDVGRLLMTSPFESGGGVR